MCTVRDNDEPGLAGAASALESTAVMSNKKRLAESVGKRLRLFPPPLASYEDEGARLRVKTLEDLWLAQRCEAEVLDLKNIRTDHVLPLGFDHVVEYRTVPERGGDGLLQLKTVFVFERRTIRVVPVDPRAPVHIGVGEGELLERGPSIHAWRLALVLSERSANGTDRDPMLSLEETVVILGTDEPSTVAAATELETSGLVHVDTSFRRCVTSFERVTPTEALFWEVDGYTKGWRPREDARALARMLVTDQAISVPAAAAKLGWAPRRMNPAASYLLRHEYAHGHEIYRGDGHFFDALYATRATALFAARG